MAEEQGLNPANRALVEREIDPVNMRIMDAIYSWSLINHLMDAARSEGHLPVGGEGREDLGSVGSGLTPLVPSRVSDAGSATPSGLGCRCYNCLKLSGERSPSWPENLGAAPLACDTLFIVCAICGNKRCPHATDHRWACTRSNAAGQHGSSYGDFAPPTDCQTSGGGE